MKKKKYLVLGGSGLVGSAIVRQLKKNRQIQIFYPKRNELNLEDQKKVFEFFRKIKPNFVILCAAKVGGIYANMTYPADFIVSNITIQNNVILACSKIKNLKLTFLGSSCIYPKYCRQPIKEEYLLTSSLEKTNEPYAVAKISGIKTIEAFKKQFKKNFISVMPTNTFGINDNFHKMNSHVVPALIRKIYEAKIKKKSKVELWGTGNPLRDLIYVDDLADAIIFLTNNYNGKEIINIGSGSEISIYDLAHKIKKIIKFKGKIYFNSKYPDGTPRKILDITKLKKLGWKRKHNIDRNLEYTIRWFVKNNK